MHCLLSSVVHSAVVTLMLFLGPRGPLVQPLKTCPSFRKKNLDHLYTGIYALWIMKRIIKPILWPNGIPWMPSWPPGTPWQPPNRPPQTHKQVSWPHCTLKITSTASQITFTFIPVTPVTPSTSSPPSPPLSWPRDLETLRPLDLETLRP